MSFVGKFHEISMYGLLTNIICLIFDKYSFQHLCDAAFSPDGFSMLFMCYLFWSSVLYIPIAIIGGFVTKYYDDGEGLTFDSDNIVVIIFAHIAEELLGLILTPFWFLKDLLTDDLDGWKIFDYATYLLELIFIAIGLVVIL